MRFYLACILFLLGSPVSACKLALALAVDISGSVDPEEYAIQMEGLASGLTDPTIGEALVQSEARILLVQWTGASRQEVSIGWTKIGSFEDLEVLATNIRDTPRAWRNFSTAIGEALRFTGQRFSEVSECERLVIDLSGDGVSNEGADPREIQIDMRSLGITVNALVIEGEDKDLTGYFWENVITYLRKSVP